ncbi:MAG TPA: hypothetical protein VJZ76_15345 [Thermoanaerobaculia bacterium]|nr:hypothetical protein [Thermoanaerobaculia bacterium]
MTAALRRLWNLEGSVGRGTYALAGIAGFAIKFCVDWLIASAGFGIRWTPLSYWRLMHVGSSITPAIFLLLFAVSVPFLWFGMAMTLLRLRDAGRSAGWAALFFFPFLNVVLFLADGRALTVRQRRPAASPRVSRLRTRSVRAPAARRRTDAPRRHDVVPAPSLARGILAVVV